MRDTDGESSTIGDAWGVGLWARAITGGRPTRYILPFLALSVALAAIAAVVKAGKLAMLQAVREYVVLASHLMLSHLAFGHRTPHADYLDHVAAVFAEPTEELLLDVHSLAFVAGQGAVRSARFSSHPRAAHWASDRASDLDGDGGVF